jgi:ketosteroid isomerase-like protein
MRIASLILPILAFHILTPDLKMSAQNIPPMIGDQIGKPKISITNPLERAGQTTGQSSQSQATRSQESELRRFLESYTVSLSNKNLDELVRYYWHGPELIVFWNTLEFHGWDSFGGQLGRVLNSPAFRKFSLKDPDLHIFGRLAWITTECRLENADNSKPEDRNARLTLILEKRRNAWSIVHQHVTILEPDQLR